MEQRMGAFGAKRGVVLQVGLGVGALGWVVIVVAGCADTKGLEARTGRHEVQPAGDEAYAQAVRAFAQEVKPRVQRAPEGVTNAAAECGIEEGPYDGALYSPEEPLASMIQLVKTEEDCNGEQIECFDRCWNSKPPLTSIKKGSGKHHEYCTTKCLKVFMDCMKNVHSRSGFKSMDEAMAWVRKHGKEILGTLVVVAGVSYVVATGGGALILVVL